MATQIIPYIPETITVHLGLPDDDDAADVTVGFADYLKNVLSSEVYPTWEESALQANALAVASYALNRVYTEFYRSRGHNFDITATTAYDQKFIEGRNIYENIAQLIDRLYTDYLRRPGFTEPLAAKFCNGTTSTCEGLSQWGSQEKALEGENAAEILTDYYGDNLEIVENAPVQAPAESYPGTPLQEGDIGEAVSVVQYELNRISQNYPAIPKVTVDGIFGSSTVNAVKAFQAIFALTTDGIVGRNTWYRLVSLYVAVQKLDELQSEGQTFRAFSWEYPESITPGETGAKVTHLQYMLSVLSQFIPALPSVTINGTYDEATKAAVEAYQRYAGLSVTCSVDKETWEAIYSQFSGIEATVFNDGALFPVRQSADAAEEVFADFEKANNTKTTAAICLCNGSLSYAESTRFPQFPTKTLRRGASDWEESE